MMRATKFYFTILVGILLGVAAERFGLVQYAFTEDRFFYILLLILQHIALVIMSIVPAIILATITGILLSRTKARAVKSIVLYILSLGQTIPALALFAFCMLWLGVGTKGAIFALIIISIIPIARNTTVGLMQIPKTTLDAAQGLGMKPSRILIEIELPLAMPLILTAIQIALVLNICTAALAFIIGAGGLGDLIFTGIAMNDVQPMILGTILTMVIAFSADRCLAKIKRKFKYDQR